MLLKTFNVFPLAEIERIRQSFTPVERWALYLFIGLLSVAAVGLLHNIYANVTYLAPSYGGSLDEGVVGAPRFINPVLALSQTDKDLTQLVYSGLLGVDTTGSLVPALAESYEVSDNGLTYTFTLRDDLAFHDGTPLTTADVAFTIKKALDPAIKSPERANWEGVTVKILDDRAISFTLTKPYAQFIQNTTLGILPEEHWDSLSADEFVFSQLNINPIGSGPFAYVSSAHSTSGIPEYITLERFDDYVRGKPFLKNITVYFYHNQSELLTALKNGTIDSASEVTAKETAALTNAKTYPITSTLPRVFAVFFNPTHNTVFKDKDVRSILQESINVENIISDILSGHAEYINTPILLQNHQAQYLPTLSPDEARAALAKAGYDSEDPLSLTLATANTEELKAVATFIVNTWKAAGVDAKLEVYEPGDLTQTVLRTREYDALLFGEVIGTFPDPYAFWHSSQIRDPGLNIAMYTNATVDKLLMQARNTVDNEERTELYERISARITSDVPAIFLYAPDFIYMTNYTIRGIHFPEVMEPHERFDNVHLWHIYTKRALDIFSH